MLKNFIISLLLLFSTLSADDSNTTKEIHWEENFHKGMVHAQEQNKPVLFIYSRHTCKYCVVLDKTTFKDKKVIEALNRDFISIISYTDENDYTPGELRSSGTPILWFLYPDTSMMFQPIQGAVDAENFLSALSLVKEEFDKVEKEKTKKAKK
jgi:thioredoxin-related protein